MTRRAVVDANTHRACLVGRAIFGPPVFVTSGAGPRKMPPKPYSAARLVGCISFFFFAYLFCISVFDWLQTWLHAGLLICSPFSKRMTLPSSNAHEHNQNH